MLNAKISGNMPQKAAILTLSFVPYFLLRALYPAPAHNPCAKISILLNVAMRFERRNVVFGKFLVHAAVEPVHDGFLVFQVVKP